MFVAGLLLLSSQFLHAREVRFEKTVDAGVLQQELIAAGLKVDWIQCSVKKCTIVMPDSEKKDPMPVVKNHIYIDPVIVRNQQLESMRILLKKWQEKKISSEEKDDLLRLLTQHVIGR